jgi:dTDP-4-amino-4,6-dideoxygalactose transaminase
MVGSELQYLNQAIASGHLSADGYFTRRAAEILAEHLGAREVLLTTSCTDALEMSALLLDLRPGDTVIVPSFTFVSSALAFVRAGARILFADIEPETLGIDPSHVARLMDDTVKAVVAVNYAGVGCDLDGLQAVLSDWDGVSLIEDNAHGLFGSYRGSLLGSFGRFSTLSFHETKNISCGEGGALVLNQQTDIERAHVLYNKGTNRRSFMLGDVDKYSWTDTGSSFGISDLLAAYLLGQLEKWEEILGLRQAVFNRYQHQLSPIADQLDIQLPRVPDDRQQAYHMFYVLLPDRGTRDKTLRTMRDANVQSTFHYVPLHTSEGGVRFSAAPTDCPVTDDISGRLLRLPFYNEMRRKDVDRVVEVFVDAVRA